MKGKGGIKNRRVAVSCFFVFLVWSHAISVIFTPEEETIFMEDTVKKTISFTLRVVESRMKSPMGHSPEARKAYARWGGGRGGTQFVHGRVVVWR